MQICTILYMSLFVFLVNSQSYLNFKVFDLLLNNISFYLIKTTIVKIKKYFQHKILIQNEIFRTIVCSLIYIKLGIWLYFRINKTIFKFKINIKCLRIILVIKNEIFIINLDLIKNESLLSF